MMYVPVDYLPEDFDEDLEEGTILHVRFCENCPLWEHIYDEFGYCRRFSKLPAGHRDLPAYVYMSKSDFCNEENIGDEEDYF